MYKVIRNILFLFDAEKVHYVSMNVLRLICKIPFLRKIIRTVYNAEDLFVEVFGLRFKNPVGLGAGFDKNAKYLAELDILGFGFIEIGTVTPLPQRGNEKPRLFRLPKDKALINRMGFNNDGVKVVAERIRKWRRHNPAEQGPSNISNLQVITVNDQPKFIRPAIIIGGNIGKNKSTDNENAWQDYEICFQELFDCVDYFVVNVSSPNTPGLRALQQKEPLQKILFNLQHLNQQNTAPKPLLLKISPDLSRSDTDDIIELCVKVNLAGIVVANTTTQRNALQSGPEALKKTAGGLSGKPLRKISLDLIKYISERTQGKLIIIGSGGIFSAIDAREKKNAGATLLQVWTGFIYEGPSIIKNICTHLNT